MISAPLSFGFNGGSFSLESILRLRLTFYIVVGSAHKTSEEFTSEALGKNFLSLKSCLFICVFPFPAWLFLK